MAGPINLGTKNIWRLSNQGDCTNRFKLLLWFACFFVMLSLSCRRIYCLTRAVLEMLKYLQYGKLYFQWKLWYKDDKNSKHYVKVSYVYFFNVLNVDNNMWHVVGEVTDILFFLKLIIFRLD